jgi:Uncharacterized protein conserved in bacteria (DUF2125)
MKHYSLAGSTALALVLFCTGAQAQVTPEQIWDNWQQILSSGGQTVTTASVGRNGDTLEVRGVSLASDNGAGRTFNATIDAMNFKDMGDGTVEVTMSETYPISITGPAPEGSTTPFAGTLTISQPGLRVIAGGGATETTYDFDAPVVGAVLSSSQEDPAAGPMTVNFSATAIKGNYTMAPTGTSSTLTSTFSAESAVVAILGKDAATQEDVSINFTMAGLAGQSSGVLLPGEAMADMAAALQAGFMVDTKMTYGTTTFDIDVKGPTNSAKVTGTAASGDVALTMNKDSMSYGLGMMNAAFSMAESSMPFPQVNVSYGEAAVRLMMPVAKSETPQDFSMVTRIVDLVISDELWGMFDPMGAFPRDPATVIIDTKGTANWAFDIMDPAQQEANANAVPGELHSLEINQLQAKAVGAEITGTGSFTFDNTDLVTWEGIPTPTGSLNLSLNGVNGLIDKLVGAGFVPEDQAMGARMMIAMFAKPVEGTEDSMTSVLEFRDKGFFANGQQLR